MYFMICNMKISSTNRTPLQGFRPEKEKAHQFLQQIRSPSPEGLLTWKKKIAQLDPSFVYEILEKIVEEIVSHSDDPDQWIDRLAEYFPLEKLEEVLRTHYPEHESGLNTAKSLVEEARHFFLMSEKRKGVPLKAKVEAFFDLCVSVLESLLNAFGLADFFRASESTLDKDVKSGRVMQLLMLFSTVSTLLLPVLGPTLSASIVGGTLLGTTTLSLLFPYIRPAPSQLPKAINWTKQYRQGELATSICRKETLDAIAATLNSSDRVKTHPMLIGKSGAGKTEMAKAFVEALERGEYPELKGKQVFYFNMADLVKGSEALSGENKAFSNIDQAMGLHRDNIILIFDEIQLACQKETSTIGEQLKTLLDPGSGRFPHVIGITTEEEYYRDIYLNNAAFARRFRTIRIETPTPAEILEILTNAALQFAPEVLIHEGSLETLVAKTKEAFPEAPEPITSLKILTKCLQKTADSQKSPLAKQEEELRIQIKSLYAQRSATQGRSLLPYSRQESIIRLQKELEKTMQAKELQEKNLTDFFTQRENLSASKKRVFQTSLEFTGRKSSPLTEKEKRHLAAFLLRTHIFSPLQTSILISKAKKLGIKTIIDAPLIDSVIREEVENERKAAEAIERGKAQIQARGSSLQAKEKGSLNPVSIV